MPGRGEPPTNEDERLQDIAQELMLSYKAKPLWDPERGLLIVRYLLRMDFRLEDQRKKKNIDAWTEYLVNNTNIDFFANVAQLLHTADYTIPLHFIRLISSASNRSGKSEEIIVNVKVPMPHGEVPKPLFETVLVYIIRGLSRMRWYQENWKGIAYGVYKMAATNTGIVFLNPIVQALTLYLARFWSSLLCNSLIFEYYRQLSGAAAQFPLSDAVGADCETKFYEALLTLDEWYRGTLPGTPHVKVKEDGKEKTVPADSLAARIRALRDLFYISMMIGKVNIIAPIKHPSKHRQGRTHGVFVVSKQSWIERLGLAAAGEEPPDLLFSLLFGGPTSLAVTPVVMAISRMYGGGLWPRVPRLFSPRRILDNGQQVSFIEDLFTERQSPPELDPSMRVQGRVEASLFMEALDVYASSIFFMPWERASALTLLLRMLGRSMGRLQEKSPLSSLATKKSSHANKDAPGTGAGTFRKSIVSTFNFDEYKVVALPMIVTSSIKGEGPTGTPVAVVYSQRLLHLAAQDLETLSGKLLEAGFGQAVDYITKTLRSHVASVAQEVDNVVMRNYDMFLPEESISEKDVGFQVRGVAVEVLNPILDLVPDPRNLRKILAMSETAKLWLIKALIDRLADSEYTRVFIYYIVEIKDINKIYDEHVLKERRPELAGKVQEYTLGYSRWRKLHDNHPQYLVDMRELAERILDLHKPLRKFTENVHLDLANMGYRAD
ncbi:MAG: hypothetical protein GXO32_06570 [Crenarchaeota archaeon]|nr:hypothetical protein [Thermoproteota archaeon]